MRNSFLPASSKEKNNTAPKYKMQTIVVSLVKLGALRCVIMAIRPAIKAAAFAETCLDRLEVCQRASGFFVLSSPLVSQIMTLLYSLSPPSLKHCILIS